jgi:hypothetical protein
MTDFKKDIIARYARHLANFGCKFKIIEEDGTEHGELVVMPEKPSSPRIQVLKQVDYKTPMAAMKPGDVINLTAPEDMPVESLRSCISGHGTNHYGAGVFTTTVDKAANSVLVLRLE